MSSVNYGSALPENNKASYSEYDTVDFQLTFENSSLQLGSLRLEGELEVVHNGDFLNATANEELNICYDPMTGAHGVCESVQTEMLGQVFENITEYPRMVKQYAVARNSREDMFNSSNVCEMRVSHDILSTQLLKGEEVRTQLTTELRENPDFSVKLDTILNSSTDLLPFDRSGPVRISINLSRTNAFLHGLDVDNTTSYSLKDLRLVYKTVPGLENRNPIELRRRLNVKQSLQSSLANISLKIPSDNVEAVTASFQVQANENTATKNNLTLEKIPNLEQLQFLFQDQTNSQVSFIIKDNSEVISRFVDAMGDTGRNSSSPSNVINNQGYGVGLKMSGGPVNLINQKFGIQINSAISSAKPLIMYLYAHSVLTLN